MINQIKRNGYTYSWNSLAPNVVIAETKIKWYDEKKLDELRRKLNKKGYKLFWSEAPIAINRKRRKYTPIELYKKYPDTDIESKIEELEEILHVISSYK